MKFSILSTLLLLWSIHGGAVSRVGGGKVRSQSSGFELTIPAPFLEFQNYTEMVRVSGPLAFISGLGVQKQFLDISEFANDFKEIASMNRNELESHLIQLGWTLVPSETCELRMQKSSRTIAAHIVTWGTGKGFVLKGPNQIEAVTAMNKALSSLTTDTRACAWK